MLKERAKLIPIIEDLYITTIHLLRLNSNFPGSHAVLRPREFNVLFEAYSLLPGAG